MEQLNLCATTTEPVLKSPRATTTEAHVPQLLKPTRLEPVLRNKRSHHNEKPVHCNKETSLVAQWLRICLPMQGTRVQALVREDPTCCGATKPMSHNY
ncbi:hypothetical protein J1605_018971 [Eschrichtius robustus]|uniref:Uncharacterized protein n=1 Tax=Eschrichtius robustus TaxID=9764 RepID=A0AB34HTS5_ESCRO|nr:hypothetical protein J1605_018971 [Eschrichtius robustus]